MAKNKIQSKKSSINITSLRRWNGVLAIILLLEALAILVLSAGTNYPVLANFIGVDTLATQATGHVVFAGGTTHQLFDISLNWLVVIFMLVGAVSYWLMATVWRNKYESDVRLQTNIIRWFDYSISGGLMLVVLGLLFGMQGFASLLLLFAAGLLIGLLGNIAEAKGSDTVSRIAYTGGLIVQIAVWVVLAGQFIVWHLYGQGATAIMAWIFFVMLTLAAVFMVIWQLSGKKIGKWSSYSNSEKSYMLLGFAGKSALAWLVFAAVLHP